MVYFFVFIGRKDFILKMRCIFNGLKQQALIVVLLQGLKISPLTSLSLAVDELLYAFLSAPDVLSVQHLDLLRADYRLIGGSSTHRESSEVISA